MLKCRETRSSYEAPFSITFCIQEAGGDSPEERFEQRIGFVPIMLKSKHCRLFNLPPKDLIAHKEEANEVGGYFIVNGNEKVVRLLHVNRRNYPIAIYRPSFTKIARSYTSYGIQMRCVRPDQSSQTITLNYTTDGRINARVIIRRQEFIIPIVILLKALVDTTDREIYDKLMAIPTGYNHSSSEDETEGMKAMNNSNIMSDNIEKLLRDTKPLNLYTREQCLHYLGSSFRIQLDIVSQSSPERFSDLQAGILFLKKFILVHLFNDVDKFNTLLLMTRKLYALIQNEIEPDNLDTVSCHEVLLPGQVYGLIFKERLEISLRNMKGIMLKNMQGKYTEETTTSNFRFRHCGVDGKFL